MFPILAEAAAEGVTWTQMVLALLGVIGALVTMFGLYDAVNKKRHQECEDSRKDLINRLDKKDEKIEALAGKYEKAHGDAAVLITDSHAKMTQAFEARAKADEARAKADEAQAESMRTIAKEFTETVRLTAKQSSGQHPAV